MPQLLLRRRGKLIAGIALVWYMSRTGREEWLLKAGQAAREITVDVEELKNLQ